MMKRGTVHFTSLMMTWSSDFVRFFQRTKTKPWKGEKRKKVLCSRSSNHKLNHSHSIQCLVIDPAPVIETTSLLPKRVNLRVASSLFEESVLMWEPSSVSDPCLPPCPVPPQKIRCSFRSFNNKSGMPIFLFSKGSHIWSCDS